MAGFEDVAEVIADPGQTLVYEEGWNSWSPAGLYPATATSPRAPDALRQIMGYRPGKPGPERGFQGEGLLGVVAPVGPARLWATSGPDVASIRARAERDRLVVSADGPVVETSSARLVDALAAWADGAGPGRIRSIPPGWCSWYHYWQGVTEDDILLNLAAIGRLGLDVEIVQIDDGHQAAPGDWLERSPRFGPLDRLAGRIRAAGRVPGIWVAPFVVGERSRLAAEHPDWLVEGADAGLNWEQRLGVLDVGHPAAAEHLESVFRTLAEQGFDYFKLDFLYAGAIPGLDAYREGMRLIRAGTGPEAILLGAGPLLPSIGLVDAMRIGPDIDPRFESATGDVSLPSGRGAVAVSRARAWMHGRLWANDPDCLIVRPEVERREAWAEHVEACDGLVFSSDPLDELDARGLKLTRRALRASTTGPVAWDPFAG